jgi:hypothetical protein
MDLRGVIPRNWITANPGSAEGELARHWLGYASTGENLHAERLTHDLLADVAGLEEQVRHAYTGRYPIELLQNAHDACGDSGRVGSASIQVTATALLVADGGIGFTPERIASLTRVGSSEKAIDRAGRDLIGYKGIGFTAVFEVSDRPQIIGRKVQFQFDVERLRDVLGGGDAARSVPVRYFPFALEPGDLGEDRDAVDRLLANGASTVVRLPYRAGIVAANALEAVQRSVRPELLLFMPHLNTISVSSPTYARSWVRKRARQFHSGFVIQVSSAGSMSQEWLVGRGSVPFSAAAAKKLGDRLWETVRRLNVAVAIPWKRGRPAPTGNGGPLFAYFPTEDQLGRDILVHGDFYLDPSRRHVEAHGAPGIPSDLVAAEAGRLVGVLARENAPAGTDLIEVLAERHGPTGFGAVVAGAIDGVLRATKFTMPAAGAKARRPDELQHLGAAVRPEDEALFVAIVSPVRDLLKPAAAPIWARAWLERLGMGAISTVDLASRIDLRYLPRGFSHISALRLLSSWIEAQDALSQWKIIEVLKDAMVMRTLTGTWTSPNEVVIQGGAPPLPTAIRRPEARMPRDSLARHFLVDKIGVDILTPARAMDDLLTSLEEGQLLGSETDRREALQFVKACWAKDPSMFQPYHGRLGIVRVLVRAAGRRVRYWLRADRAYFSRAWLPRSTAESTYGALGATEFLAEPPPTDPATRREQVALYRALGVVGEPRLVPLPASVDPPAWQAWKSLPGVEPAFSCDEGHTGSQRQPDGLILDRLDALLGASGSTLLAVLGTMDDPYGGPVVVKCMHGSHSGRAGRKRAVPGYQEWRLTTVAWVPVINDPTGKTLRVPQEAWTQVQAARRYLMIPRAAVPARSAGKLRFVSSEEATPTSIERALLDLYSVWTDAADAPADAIQTARWLMGLLDRRTERSETLGGTAPPLLAVRANLTEWSTDPAIADIPGLAADPPGPVLPAGRWPGLRRAYGLRRLSEIISGRATYETKRGVPLLLSARRRAELLAFLNATGPLPDHVAGRLAVLREIGVSRLTVHWQSSDGALDEIHEPSVHLDLLRNKAGARTGALVLRRADLPIDFLGMGAIVADYLDLFDRDVEIGEFLRKPHDLLLHRNVGMDDVDDAFRTIAGRRRFVADDDLDLVPPKSPGDGRRATPADEGAPPRNGAERSYIDAATTRFGKSREVPRTQPPERSREWQAPDRSTREYEPGAKRNPPSSGPSGSIRRDIEAERIAVDLVSRYATEVLGAVRVVDRQADNVGWDLEFEMATGERIPVEVKGSAGDAPFRITPNERAAAEATGNFTLYFVTGTHRAAKQRRMFRIDRLGEQLSESHLQVTDWVVVAWESLAHEEIELDLDPSS